MTANDLFADSVVAVMMMGVTTLVWVFWGELGHGDRTTPLRRRFCRTRPSRRTRRRLDREWAARQAARDCALIHPNCRSAFQDFSDAMDGITEAMSK